MEVNVHHAKTNLSKLIQKAESGEEVIIARNGKPAVRLVPIAESPRKSRKTMWGAGIGKIWVSPDWDSPEVNDQITALMLGSDDDELLK